MHILAICRVIEKRKERKAPTGTIVSWLETLKIAHNSHAEACMIIDRLIAEVKAEKNSKGGNEDDGI